MKVNFKKAAAMLLLSIGLSTSVSAFCYDGFGKWYVNGDIIPHPTNMSQFYVCDFGTWYLFECADGLWFHPGLGRCEFPWNF
jgi:hypothetical protein